MNHASIARLLLLPAIRGASLLAMRIGAPLPGPALRIPARVFHLVSGIAAVRALTATYLIPLFGIPWGTLLHGESVGWHSLLGGLTVLTGTAWVTGFSPSALLPSRRQNAA